MSKTLEMEARFSMGQYTSQTLVTGQPFSQNIKVIEVIFCNFYHCKWHIEDKCHKKLFNLSEIDQFRECLGILQLASLLGSLLAN